jgi:hypothetical protein
VFRHGDQPQVGQTTVIFNDFGQFWGFRWKNQSQYLFDFIYKFETNLLKWLSMLRFATSPANRSNTSPGLIAVP